MKNIDLSHINFQNAENLKQKYFEILGLNSTDFSEIKLAILNLSARATHVLLNLHVRTIEDLLNESPRNIANARNCGVKSFNEINNRLFKFFNYDYIIKEKIKDKTIEVSNITKSMNVFLYFETLANKLIKFETDKIEQIRDSSKYDTVCIELCCVFEDFLKTLPSKDRDAEIFRKRIKIEYVSKCTLEGIGKNYSLSRERIRQIIDREFRRVSSSRRTYKKQIYLEKIKNIIYCFNEDDLFKIFSSTYFDLYNIHYVSALLSSFFGKSCAKNIVNKIEKTSNQFIVNEKVRIKALAEEEKLKNLICFPSSKQTFQGSIKNLPQLRKVEFDNGFITGYISSEKAINELPHESGAEKKILKYLDNNQYVSEINVQCIRIPYGKNKYYYPDIIFKTKDNCLCIVEVKPFYQMALSENIEKFRLLHNYCKERNVGYLIIDDRFNSIMKYKNLICNSKLEKVLLNELNKFEKIDYSQFRKILNDNQLNHSINELATVIFHNKLKWKLKPFLIER